MSLKIFPSKKATCFYYQVVIIDHEKFYKNKFIFYNKYSMKKFTKENDLATDITHSLMSINII